MPSWLPGASRHHGAIPIDLNVPSTSGSAAGLATSFEPPGTNLQADASSSDSDYAPLGMGTNRSKHRRSMSHPIPSLFDRSKARQNSHGGLTRDVDAFRAVDTRSKQKDSGRTKKAEGSNSNSKDFATGNCMTCDSLVRWPKNLSVFKCTICLTINDVVPTDKKDKKRKDIDNTEASQARLEEATAPISLEHTKNLVRQCLHSYLSKRFCQRTNTGDGVYSVAHRPRPGQESLTPSQITRNRGPSDAGEYIRIPRKNINSPGAQFEFAEPPSLSLEPPRSHTTASRSYSSPHGQRPGFDSTSHGGPVHAKTWTPERGVGSEPRRIFKPLEDYIASCFRSLDAVNESFVISKDDSLPALPRAKPTTITTTAQQQSKLGLFQIPRKPIENQAKRTETARAPHDKPKQTQIKQGFELDPRLLMIGDVAENGLWWTEGHDGPTKSPSSSGQNQKKQNTNRKPVTTTTRIADVNWKELENWYLMVTRAGDDWASIYDSISHNENFMRPSQNELLEAEKEILMAQAHTERCLLKSTENILKRPGRPLSVPADLRFLLLLTANPLLFVGTQQSEQFMSSADMYDKQPESINKNMPTSGPLSGQHSGIIKRIMGLLSNSSVECHSALTSWLSKCDRKQFSKIKDLAAGFLTYRMLRHRDKKQQLKSEKVDITGGLIPEMQRGRNGGYIHDDLSFFSNSKKTKEQTKLITYTQDWQVKAASKVLAFMFTANENAASRHGGRYKGQTLPLSDFYVSMVDDVDLVADFETWESKKSGFSFCQYPFLMSIWAKIKILEYDARRQMQLKARDAFLDSIMTRKNVNQYFFLDVRRDCLVEDSLTAVSHVLGSGGDDIKKGLRITFKGEEGIDGGGLRKEWFLLLIREVFNPDHGLFLYDDESKFCYFNPNTFETSDQYFLVGVVVGLAIYNSTILDVPLPPFAFRKLLVSAPPMGNAQPNRIAPTMKYSLSHLAEYQPRVAHSLQQLLDYDGDVESTFCLDFVIETDKYGSTVAVPLCTGGERKPVTNTNRREYVDLYVRYVLDLAVQRQYEPFKRGFYTVCGGNAFSLFRPEEIELLVRGSDDPLDVAALRAVATYDNWSTPQPDGSEPVIEWFWQTLQRATPKDQRRMLSFITGSDRLPATGASALTIKISCLGEDTGRFPIARTCFNQLSLWRYQSREQLQYMVWRAVHESEGFGLK